MVLAGVLAELAEEERQLGCNHEVWSSPWFGILHLPLLLLCCRRFWHYTLNATSLQQKWISVQTSAGAGAGYQHHLLVAASRL